MIIVGSYDLNDMGLRLLKFERKCRKYNGFLIFIWFIFVKSIIKYTLSVFLRSKWVFIFQIMINVGIFEDASVNRCSIGNVFFQFLFQIGEISLFCEKCQAMNTYYASFQKKLEFFLENQILNGEFSFLFRKMIVVNELIVFLHQ